MATEKSLKVDAALRQWLAALDLSHYADVFERDDVTLDVLGELSEADLEKLGVTLGHRKKLLKAIKSYTPPVSDNETLTASDVSSQTHHIRAERRQLTVLFCDLVGSTQLSQQLDAEDLRALMQKYQAACRATVNRYEGYIAQFLGDGIMAYFGWPTAHEDDADRAVRSALEIVSSVKEVTRARTLSVRIGVATGAVVVGEQAGEDASAPSLAVGETPNLAARLQSLAGENEIVISPSTHRLLGQSFLYEDLGPRKLKGIVEEIRAWKVLGNSEIEGRFDATRSLSPLIGRDEELQLLLRRWEQATEGEGQVVLLCGEPGIGKSRLIQALRDELANQGHYTVRYQCSPYHKNSAFHPLIEQLQKAAGFIATDTPHEKRRRLKELFGYAEIKNARAMPLVATLLGVPAEGEYAESTDSPQRQKDETVETIAQQIIGLAERTPVFITLEDAHWIDPSTLEVFDFLIQVLLQLRILLVIAYRPEFEPAWTGQSHVTLLTLNRFGKRQCEELARHVARDSALPTEILTQIAAKTDGVPLFVEELTKSVLESGLVEDAQQYDAGAFRITQLAIPSTLRDSLTARLDRLAPVKEVIQLAAVIGREFRYRLMATLASMPPTKLQEALDQLVSSELVHRRGSGLEAVYVFKHALVQEAAYESILKSRRQQLHAKVATALEQDQQIVENDPALLGIQFDQARLVDRAVHWYMEAGKRATVRSANKEALHHFNRALTLVEDDSYGSSDYLERRIELHTEIGRIHMDSEGWASKDALHHFTEAEKASRDSAQPELRFRTLVGMVTSLTWCGHAREARSHSEELVKLSRTTGERIHRLYAHQVLGQTLMYGGKFDLSLAESRLASALYDFTTDRHLAFRYGHDAGMVSLWWTAYTSWDTGLLEKALQSSEEALLLARKIEHPFTLSSALYWMTDISYLMWLPDRILIYADEAIEVARRHGYFQLEAASSFQRAWAMAQDCLSEAILETMRAAFERYRTLGAAAIIAPRMTAQLAAVYGQAGRADEGLAVLASSPDRQPGRTRVRYAEISRIEGDLHLSGSAANVALAEDLYKEAVQIAVEDGQKTKQLRAAASLASLWHKQGKTEAARKVLEPLYMSFTEGFDMPDMRHARQLLAEMVSRPTTSQ